MRHFTSILGFILLTAVIATPAYAGFLGSTSIAGVSTGGSANASSATRYLLSEDGIVLNLNMYCIGNGNVKMGIYRPAGAAPGNLIVVNNTSTACTAGTWVTLPIPPTFLTAGIYWVASIQNNASMMAFRAAETNQFAYNVGGNFTTGLVDPFPSASFQSNDYIMYASYKTYASVTIRNPTSIRGGRTIIR